LKHALYRRSLQHPNPLLRSRRFLQNKKLSLHRETVQRSTLFRQTITILSDKFLGHARGIDRVLYNLWPSPPVKL